MVYYEINNGLLTLNDAPPNSLKDSNASPKMKSIEERIGARFLAHSTFRVRGVCWNPEMETRMNDKQVNYSYKSAQAKQQVG